MTKKILIANPFGIGDVLFSTPLIAALKKAMPDCFIGYACNTRTAPMLSCHPGVNEVIVFERDELSALWRTDKARYFREAKTLWKKIKGFGFDVVFDLSLSRDYPLFFMLAGVKERIGYNFKNRGLFLTKKTDIKGYHDRHIVEYYLDLLGKLGIQPAGSAPEAFTTGGNDAWAEDFLRRHGVGAGDSLVGIVPAGGASWGREAERKHWAREKFALLADRLIRQSAAKIIILGSPEEKEILREVSGRMKEKAAGIVDFAGLGEFISLIGKCGLVVANDGGPLHLAVARGAATVSIFGPVDDRVYGPYPRTEKHVVIGRNLDCRPCYRRFRMAECGRNLECLRAITVDEVASAAAGLLADLKNNWKTDRRRL